MSKIYDKKISKKVGRTPSYNVHIEYFNTAMEVVDVCNTRQMTSNRFYDMRKHSIDKDWHGVNSYEQALEYMRNGYQPTVDAMREKVKTSVNGVQEKRFSFKNDIQGFAPIVPLAMMGVPQNMLNSHMKQIKAKVIDVYYDMTNSSGTEPEELIEAGEKLIGAIIDLEKQGYRFNLYAVQSYTNDEDADMLIVKIKSANQPIDLKRTSFPLMHPAFFRVIGFDWYSKLPNGKYRGGYGRALKYTFDDDTKFAYEQLFGKNTVCLTGVEIRRGDMKGVLTNAG